VTGLVISGRWMVWFAAGLLRASTTAGSKAGRCHNGALGHSYAAAVAAQRGRAICEPAVIQRYCASYAALRGRWLRPVWSRVAGCQRRG